MVCIYCSNDTKVINSRLQKKANQTWRRRQCLKCQAVFTTLEKFDTSKALRLVRNNHFEPFSRDVLLLSVHDSLKHRKTAIDDATALTNTILSKLSPKISEATIKRNDLVQITADTLKRFDKAAATSYLAFHPQPRTTSAA